MSPPDILYGPLTIILLVAVLWLTQRQRSHQRRVDDRIEQLEDRWQARLELLQTRLAALTRAMERSEVETPTAAIPDDKQAAVKIAATSTPPPSGPEIRVERETEPAKERAATTTASPSLPPQTITPKPSPIKQIEDPQQQAPSSPFDWFLRSHLLVQVGIVILFIGIVFLLKYVTDRGWFSLELRHVAAAIGGVLLAGAGWMLRERARAYALALQGGGLGVIYLTTFFAFRVYELIPSGLAFVVFAALGVISAALAVLNDARILAFLAALGAFLAPALAADGGGSHVSLFSYYVAVNAVILAIGWFKSWRSLNLIGFTFTLAAGAAWGSQFYKPEFFPSTEPFLILFFLVYVAIAVLFTLKQPKDDRSKIDSAIDVTLVFGNPLATFTLQTMMVYQYPYGVGWSALTMGLFHLALTAGLWRRLKDRHRLLTESFLFLGFFFLTISIPLFFAPHITSAMWAISGAASVWVGVRRQRTWLQAWGVITQLAASGVLVWHIVDNGFQFTPPFLNAVYIGGVILSLSALFSAYQLHANREQANQAFWRLTRLLEFGLTIWGLLWWFGIGLLQVADVTPYTYLIASIIVFLSLSCAAGELLGNRLRWTALRIPPLLLLPLLLFIATQLYGAEQPFAGGGWIAWPLAIFVHYWVLHNYRKPTSDSEQPDALNWLSLYHAGGLWLITFLVAWFAGWQVTQFLPGESWFWASAMTVLSLIILCVTWFIDRLPWPIATNRHTYLLFGLGPLVFFGIFWILGVGLNNSGDSAPVPYIPLLNPLDLAQILFFGSTLLWISRLRSRFVTEAYWLWGGVLFAAVNLSIARAVHQLGNVAFTFDTLYHSAPLQSIYAVFWGDLALALIITANRRGKWALWGAGVLLLAATMLKLFIVDLANSDSLARIISFIGVGLLTILIAYFLPARQGE